ncbi:cofilin family protein [Streptomyces sp. NPDC055005]
MSDSIGLSAEGNDALQHLKGRRAVNTVIFRCAQAPGALALELEGNLTHEELVRALPPDAARLVFHELAFATREGARRHETLLILWLPPAAEGQEGSCTVGYVALEESLPSVRVHLTARLVGHLDYARLVALAG